MEIKARGKALNGSVIYGHYCKHEFYKLAGELTDEEKAAATPIPTGGGDGGEGGGEPTAYIAVRDSIQQIGTVEVVAEGVELEAQGAVFTEIVAGSQQMFTGYYDKQNNEIYEGDTIRYQNGATTYETYKVIYADGHFTTSPAWQWGCNWSPFDNRKVEVIA